AENGDEHAGRQRRGEDIDQIVAQEKGADQAFLAGGEALDHHGAAVATAGQLVDARARSGGQRGFRAGKEGAEQQQDDDGCDGYPDDGGQDGRISSRNSATAAGSTSFSMKLLPMPRVRMKVSAPRVTFLSWAI